jgi:hypothetical protein
VLESDAKGWTGIALKVKAGNLDPDSGLWQPLPDSEQGSDTEWSIISQCSECKDSHRMDYAYEISADAIAGRAYKMIHFDAAQEYSDDLIDQVDDMTILVKCNALKTSGPGCANHIADEAKLEASHPTVGHTSYSGYWIRSYVGWDNCYTDQSYSYQTYNDDWTMPCTYHQQSTYDLSTEYSQSGMHYCSHPLEFGGYYYKYIYLVELEG